MADGVVPINAIANGCNGNGSTNNSSQIAAMIAKLPAQGGDLFFPAGLYSIQQTINIPKEGSQYLNVCFVGEGTAVGAAGGQGDFNVAAGPTVLINDVSGGQPMFRILDDSDPGAGTVVPWYSGGARYITFRQGSGSGSAFHMHALLHSNWINVAFHGFGADGFLLEGEVFYTVFYQCSFMSTQVRLKSTCMNTSWIGGQFSRAGSYSAFLMDNTNSWGGTGPTFNSVWLEQNNQHSIDVKGLAGIRLFAVYFEGNGDDGAGGWAEVMVRVGGDFDTLVYADACYQRLSNGSVNHSFVKTEGSGKKVISINSLETAADSGSGHAIITFGNTNDLATINHARTSSNGRASNQVKLFAGSLPSSGNRLSSQCYWDET